MLRNKYEKMYEHFEQYYSCLCKQVVDWWPSGRTCLTVKLEDGDLLEFDSYCNSIRTIKTNGYTKDIQTLRKDIGTNIKKMIQTRNISQSEIAKQSGLTEAMLSRYIHGTSMPSIDKINTLAAVLDCRITELIGELYE